MKLKRLSLRHFRGFRALDLSLGDTRTTALAGVNGAGKSTALDAAAKALSWLPARLRSINGQGRHIDYADIRGSEFKARIEVHAETENGETVRWVLERAQRGSGARAESDLAEVHRWASARTGSALLDGQQQLPVLAYYPTNRAVLDIPARIRKRHDFGPLASYDEALGANSTQFRTFFEWFREREDLENEQRLDEPAHRDPQLAAVRQAVESLLPGYSGLRIRRNPQRMEVTKDGAPLRVDQLSDGEKCLLALAGDLALRLALANPGSPTPLHGTGIVLVDEVELHLHPRWQRTVLERLEDTFRGCQFIVSTHSPLVLGHVKRDAVWLLDAGGSVEGRQLSTWGHDAERILEETLGTLTRPTEAQRRLDELFALLSRREFDAADSALSALKADLGDDPELVRAHALRQRLARSAS